MGFLADDDIDAVVAFEKLGAVARAAHPTPDHFLPLLFTLGLKEPGEAITTFNDAFDLGSISMLSWKIS